MEVKKKRLKMADNQEKERIRQSLIKYIMFDCPKGIECKLDVLMEEVTNQSLLACAAKLNPKSTMGSLMHRFGVSKWQAVEAISRKKRSGSGLN